MKKISWPFTSVLASYLCKNKSLQSDQGSIHSNILSTKAVIIHNDIQRVVFTEALQEILTSIFKRIRSGNV